MDIWSIWLTAKWLPPLRHTQMLKVRTPRPSRNRSKFLSRVDRLPQLVTEAPSKNHHRLKPNLPARVTRRLRFERTRLYNRLILAYIFLLFLFYHLTPDSLFHVLSFQQ